MRRATRLLIVLALAAVAVPLVAEAASLLAGASGMRFRDFLAAASAGNLAIAFAWSLAGTLGRQTDAFQWVLVGSLAIPVVATWLVTRRRFWQDSQRHRTPGT